MNDNQTNSNNNDMDNADLLEDFNIDMVREITRQNRFRAIPVGIKETILNKAREGFDTVRIIIDNKSIINALQQEGFRVSIVRDNPIVIEISWDF